jgi:hypothetical protein
MTHLAECESCRSVFGDMEEIHAHCVPEGFEVEAGSDTKAETLLRSKVLRRAARGGARFSKAAVKGPNLFHLRPARDPRLPVARLFLRPGAAFAAGTIVALAIAGAAGFALRHRSSVYHIADASHEVASADSSVDVSKAQIDEVAGTQAAAALAQQEAQLELSLKEARAETARLQEKLSESNRKGSEFERANAQRISDLEQQLLASRANESKAHAELDKVRDAHSTDQVALAAQEQDIRELNAKLEQQSAAINREDQLLSAGREIRDVIAARNLHIIDVYDTDGEGKTKKAFGRAFYTEGKSLIFYAYDLPSHRTENAKYAYYAWGKRDGNDQTIRSLGLMYNDDQSQKRWVLKITDPELLSQIDSVFITLERTDGPSNRPKGKGILSAYLHSPSNHP